MTLAGSAQELPNLAKSVEFVFVRPASDRTSYFYEKYEGSPWKMATLQEGFTPNDRTAFLLSQRAAVLP
jgi:hypothetical protein